MAANPPSFEEQIAELQNKRKALAAAAEGATAAGGDRVAFGRRGAADGDDDVYSRGSREGYLTELPMGNTGDDDDDDDGDNNHRHGDDDGAGAAAPGRRTYGATAAMIREAQLSGADEDPFKDHRPARIADREDEYRARRHRRVLSPERGDAFSTAAGGAAGTASSSSSSTATTYAEVMQSHELDLERAAVLKQIADKQKAAGAAPAVDGPVSGANTAPLPAARRRRWDAAEPTATVSADEGFGGSVTPAPAAVSQWDAEEPKPKAKRSRWDATPTVGDATPMAGGSGLETPTGGRRSRWDETPVGPGSFGAPGLVTPVGGMAMDLMTPSAAQLAAMTPEQVQALRVQGEMDERNRPLTDEELDAMFPQDGYKILDAPASYVPVTPMRRLLATPTPAAGLSGFSMQEEVIDKSAYGITVAADASLPELKPEDEQHFRKLLQNVDETQLEPEELRERKIMTLLLKIKNGTPPMRKAAMRQITDKAREFGAGPLFNQVLPLLMSPALEDQERHLLVKVIDRILYKLDDLVRPFVHKILVVIEPLLIDEDYYARIEGREIISNLAKAAGLATMISVMRPDIDDADEYVRNTTARAFAVVASALGVPALLPFLKAVCRSKKSWQARHTGVKIVQQMAILMGCAVLPHLKSLVDIVQTGLGDEQLKVKTITALALAALAEAAAPYGIEAFDEALPPLFKGTRDQRGKSLAAYLKAIGYIIPLMDGENAGHYTKEVMPILVREFASPDEEMKKIVLKVVKQCVGTDGVDAAFIRREILPPFFKQFWVQRMALDRRNYKQLVETTEELAARVGAAEVVGRLVDDLKDESEQYRKMVMEAVERIVAAQGAGDVDQGLEERLVDGILYAFQEQTQEDAVMLTGFGVVINALGLRAKPYIPQICGTITWRLNNKTAKVRQQAADLIARIAVVMQKCGEEAYMNHLGVILFENLGEEYPEVLGSILGALKAIVNVIGMTRMQPPIKDLLPRLTPILKNRHEKVIENGIDLVGRIADRGAEFVSAREWMRICFELLELLKAHKKAIRRAAVNTFGYIAKAIGPQDVLATLLSNLKVQERTNRVCTTVAIAIVAESCAPFTVLPGLMNEYRVPELNVQNGVLKSLSFLFEYIGEMGKDYIYAVTPLLEDALMDRDAVHRQTACTAIKHLSLGVVGFGADDALAHLLNFVWPNVFEASPHVINATMEAVNGLHVALGPARLLGYTLQGLFHPARKVREVYWKIYNGLYLAHQDALVAHHPHLVVGDDPDERDRYARAHLEYIL